LSFVTCYDTRDNERSPIDTYNRLDLKVLKIQTEALFCSLYTMFQDSSLTDYMQAFSFSQIMDRTTDPAGLHIRGQVGVYIPEIDNYKGIKALIWFNDRSGHLAYGRYVLSSEDDGNFYIPQISRNEHPDRIVLPFVINETTGNVLYAPDLGTHKWASTNVALKSDKEMGWVVVFKCATMVLPECVDPRTQTVPQGAISYSVLDHLTHSHPTSYGSISLENLDLGVSMAVLFVPPEIPIEIIFASSYERGIPFGFLVNASQSHPEGVGYTLKEGQQYIGIHLPLRMVENLYHVEGIRINLMESLGVFSPSSLLRPRVLELINKSYRAIEDHQYDAFYNYSMNAWSLQQDLYSKTKSAVVDAVNTAPIFAILLVPFTFLAELLFFRATGVKRILAYVGIFSSLFIFLYFFHSGFKLASNILMVVIGTIMSKGLLSRLWGCTLWR